MEWNLEWSLESGRIIQSKVRVRLDSGVKRGAKTGRMGKLGRRELERQVECKVKCKENGHWSQVGEVLRRVLKGPLKRLSLFASMYLPSSATTLLQY